MSSRCGCITPIQQKDFICNSEPASKSVIISMATHPKTYKAASFEMTNSLFVLKDLRLQPPNAREVLIKVLASGVYGTNAGLYSSAPFVTYFLSVLDMKSLGISWLLAIERAGGDSATELNQGRTVVTISYASNAGADNSNVPKASN